MIKAAVHSIVYHLPEQVLTNEMLATEFPDWRVDKIRAKTGIDERHIAKPGECSSDLAVNAAQALFAEGACAPEDIDYLLFCTQTPDYLLPTSACLIQDRLGLSRDIGALDFNLGSSGYVYGLGLAKGLIETGQARSVLFLVGDTYSKFVHHEDRSCRPIFGDGAAATWVRGVEAGPGPDPIGPFVQGTDGRGGTNLIVAAGGMRRPHSPATALVYQDELGNDRIDEHLFMNGPEIFSFTIEVVPAMVESLWERSGLGRDGVDLYVFHQANRFILSHLQAHMKIPDEKFVYAMDRSGNTVSATIPIALKEAEMSGRLRAGQRVMLVGFGVGYSWAATLIQWQGRAGDGD